MSDGLSMNPGARCADTYPTLSSGALVCVGLRRRAHSPTPAFGKSILLKKRALLLRPVDVSNTVQAAVFETLRQTQGERFRLHGGGSIADLSAASDVHEPRDTHTTPGQTAADWLNGRLYGMSGALTRPLGADAPCFYDTLSVHGRGGACLFQKVTTWQKSWK